MEKTNTRKSNKIEEATCKFCKCKFLRYKKNLLSKKRPKAIVARQSHCLYCSRECARKNLLSKYLLRNDKIKEISL